MSENNDSLDNMSPPLTLYITSWCPYCHKLKAALKDNHISWREIDVEKDLDAAEYVTSVNNGNRIVPTVRYIDGSIQTNPSIIEVKQKLGL